jgi:hypothetical protein
MCKVLVWALSTAKKLKIKVRNNKLFSLRLGGLTVLCGSGIRNTVKSFFETGSSLSIAQTDLELSILLPQPLSAGITGVNHHTQP